MEEESDYQYVAAIITVIGVIAMVTIVALVIGNSSLSIVYHQFADSITNFFTAAKLAVFGS